MSPTPYPFAELLMQQRHFREREAAILRLSNANVVDENIRANGTLPSTVEPSTSDKPFQETTVADPPPAQPSLHHGIMPDAKAPFKEETQLGTARRSQTPSATDAVSDDLGMELQSDPTSGFAKLTPNPLEAAAAPSPEVAISAQYQELMECTQRDVCWRYATQQLLINFSSLSTECQYVDTRDCLYHSQRLLLSFPTMFTLGWGSRLPSKISSPNSSASKIVVGPIGGGEGCRLNMWRQLRKLPRSRLLSPNGSHSSWTLPEMKLRAQQWRE
jgi:hypothetical protein